MLFNENTKVRLGYLGTVEGKDMYETVRNNPEQIISLYEKNEPDDKRYLDMNREFFKTNNDVYSYYFFAKENGVDIFVDMPLVKNDDLFKWIRRDFGHNGNIKTLWTSIKKGFFKFNCSYHLNTKDANIVIFWKEYRQEHIRTLRVNNATNEDILAAINEYMAEFETHVIHSVRTSELHNESN